MNNISQLINSELLYCQSSIPHFLLHLICQTRNLHLPFDLLCSEFKICNLKQYNLQSIDSNNVMSIYSNMKKKFYHNLDLSQLDFQWHDNQLRLFLWILIHYCYIYSRKIEQITIQQWNLFSSVFFCKNHFVFQYQVKLMQMEKVYRKQWTQDEDNCLKQAVLSEMRTEYQTQLYKWGEIAKKIYIKSKKRIFLAPKQCRQRWINHLDPQRVKDKWTHLEDSSLINYVRKIGKKWSLISKLMQSKRTQHTVKNRYNSLIRKQKKRNKQVLEESDVQQNLLQKFAKWTSRQENEGKDQMKNLESENAQNQQGKLEEEWEQKINFANNEIQTPFDYKIMRINSLLDLHLEQEIWFQKQDRISIQPAQQLERK